MKICKTEQEFIDYIAPIAQRVCKRYGFKPSILIAQTGLENGFSVPRNFDNQGIYDLMKYNCMVGQKASLLNDTWAEYSVWPGMKQGKYKEYSFLKETTEEYDGEMTTIPDTFRKFDSVEQSLADYVLFLLYSKDSVDSTSYRYGPDVVNIQDPQRLITEVGEKYATGSSYAKHVWNIVNKYNLTKYDDLTGVEPTDIVPDILKHKKTETTKEEEKKVETKTSNVKKLVPPKFIDNRAASRSQVPAWRAKSEKKYIVVHYLGLVGQNFELWDNGYGATFTIAWNGDVYYTADYTAVTWQCGGSIQGENRDGSGVAPHRFHGKCTNYNSVSIETCVKRTDNKYEGDDNDDKWYFTEESQESLVWAVSKMMDDLDIPIERVIRHFDVSGKICPNPFVKNNGLNGNWTWEEFKANLAQYRKDGTITIPDRSKNPVTTSSSSSSTLLKKGSSGSAVKELQTMLIACGYPCGSAGADGSFGGATYAALKSFQKTHDLDADGIYGEKSKAALTAAYKATTQESEKKTTTKKSTKKKTTTKKFMIGDLDYSPVFDPEYYRKHNQDLQAAFGDDVDKLWNHMRVFGLKEGRQASANFNPHNYRERYPDLKKAFGYNWPAYYEHWLRLGSKPPENRIGK